MPLAIQAFGPLDLHFMQLALEQAAQAALAGEVPVGAVVVQAGRIIGTGRNSPIGSCDPSAHAEVNALRAAALTLGNYRLEDCTLYVTLEPCAMCCGALLHSRLQRVVFGATEPKTGCAGSVLNLFDPTHFAHTTIVEGGLLAPQASQLLQDFFQNKRQEQRLHASPLREDALRTQASRFDALPDYPWPAHYISDVPGLAGLRMHYLDLGPAESPQVILAVHPIPGWSYSLREQISDWLGQGARVIAPDLLGFGKSDKPKRESVHTPEWHVQCLLALIARLGLQNISVVVAGDSHPVLPALTAMPQTQFKVLQVLPFSAASQVAHDHSAMEAPYPDSGHRAGERAFACKKK